MRKNECLQSLDGDNRLMANVRERFGYGLTEKILYLAVLTGVIISYSLEEVLLSA